MKARRVAIRLDEAEWGRLQAMARDHGMRPSEYMRGLLSAPVSPLSGSHDDDRLARLETLALATAVSAYEVQSVLRSTLTPEQMATLKKHRAAQFAAWRAWGVKADYIGLDMRPEAPNPKTHKESSHE